MLSPSSNKDPSEYPASPAKLNDFEFLSKPNNASNNASNNAGLQQSRPEETLGSPLSLSEVNLGAAAAAGSPGAAVSPGNTGALTAANANTNNRAGVSNNAASGASGAAAATGRPRRSNGGGDLSSLSSNCSSFGTGEGTRQDSLIFERFVQDPMTDAQPVPSSLPRHFSSENFVPPSLDTATGLITGNDPQQEVTLEELELGLPQRRPSSVSLQAAFASPSRASNLTRQMRGSNGSSRPSLHSAQTDPQLATLQVDTNFPGAQPQLQQQQQHHQQQPQLQVQSGSPQQQLSMSPVMMRENKSASSFFSYADMINQENEESTFPIRRPSLSLTMSSGRLGRAGSIASVSTNGCSCVAPNRCSRQPAPRSPILNGSGSRRNSAVRYPQSVRSIDAMSDDNDNDQAMSPTDAPRKLVGLSRRSSSFVRISMTHSNSASSANKTLWLTRTHTGSNGTTTPTTTAASAAATHSTHQRIDDLVDHDSSSSEGEFQTMVTN